MTAHYADVSDPASVEACIAEIVAEHGRIDNLVTSAGFTENFEAVAYPIDRMRKLWGVNVDGTYLFATSVARHLVRYSLSLSPSLSLSLCPLFIVYLLFLGRGTGVLKLIPFADCRL